MAVLKNKTLGWASFGVFILIVAIYLMAVFPWMLKWGATEVESSMSLPGDEVVPTPMYCSTRAIMIEAPVEDVWPWIAQLGQDPGGFYSYSWLENMLLADIHNARAINPDWLERRGGERFSSTFPDYT